MGWFNHWYTHCKALWQRRPTWLWRSPLAVEATIPTWQVGELCLWLQQLFLSQQLHAFATQSRHVSSASAAMTAAHLMREGVVPQPLATHYLAAHDMTRQLLQLNYCRLRLHCFSDVDIAAWIDRHSAAAATGAGAASASVPAAPILSIGMPTWRQRRKVQLWQLDIVARTVSRTDSRTDLHGAAKGERMGPQIEFEFCLQRLSALSWPSASMPRVKLQLDKDAFCEIGKAAVAP